jgi:hypothetical protein
MEWQPIETAPKDGTEVLIWREDCGPLMGRYCSANELSTMSDRERDELDEASLFQEDWWGGDADGGGFRLEGSEVPTHWMPLPTPPASLVQGTEATAGGGANYPTPEKNPTPAYRHVGVTACPAPQPRSHIEGVNLPPVNPRPAPPPRPAGVKACAPGQCVLNAPGEVGMSDPCREDGCADARRTCGVATVVEPIPDRVYWAPLAGNFYDADGKGRGLEFYLKWKPRCAEFPQGESWGWGPGSAHNPFKDPPRNAGVRVLDEGQRREQIKDACAEVFGWRKCEFCGCNTNAKVRACCQRGKDADGVIGPPAPPVVARVFIEVGQSPRFLLQPTAPVAVKQGMLREGWNDLVPAGVKEPLVLGTPAELATRRIGPADGVEASDEAELRKRIGKLRTALQQLENGAGADVAHAALEDDDAR